MGKLPDVGTLQYEIGIRDGANRNREIRQVEIKYVAKADGSNPDRLIAFVAGVRNDGRIWKLTEEQVIETIKRNVSFVVKVNGKLLDVIVSKRSGREYIKTTADRYMPEQLLSLPECP